jgi:transcriptional regulator with XRE-family HTH domain
MRYIRQQDAEEIVKLHQDEGWLMKDLAKKYGISEATVSNYIHGRTTPRFMKRRAGRPKVIPVTKTYASPDFKEEDFSELPDHVLFQHVRECNFIG